MNVNRSPLVVPLLVLMSCARPGEGRGYDLTHSLSITPEGGGYLMMSVGDSLALQVDSSECHGDVCDSTPLGTSGFEWSATPAGRGTMAAGGVLRAMAAGVVHVVARGGGRDARDSVTIYPPVAGLEWQPRPAAARAGDTLRVSVIARDSNGREVARISAHTIMGGTGRAGQLLSWGGPEPTAVWLDQAGQLILVARLAHRWDTLSLTVREERRE